MPPHPRPPPPPPHTHTHTYLRAIGLNKRFLKRERFVKETFKEKNELAPGCWSLIVRKRQVATGFSAVGCYYELSRVCKKKKRSGTAAREHKGDESLKGKGGLGER